MLRPEPLCKVTSSFLLPTHTYQRDLRKDQEGLDASGRLSGHRRYSRASHRLIPSEPVVAAEIQLWELVEAALQNEWPHGGLDRVSSACMTASLQLLQFDQLWDGEGRAGRYSSHSPSPSQWRAAQAVGYLRVFQDSGRQSTWKCPAWWMPIIHSCGLQGAGDSGQRSQSLTLALRSSCWNSGCGRRPWFFTKAGTSGGRWLS